MKQAESKTSHAAGHPEFGGVESLRALLTLEVTLMQMLAKDHALAPTLEWLAQALGELAGGAICAIQQLSAAGTELQTLAAPGLPPLMRAPQDAAAAPDQGLGLAALHTAAPRIVTDIGASALPAELRQAARKAGLAACWSLSIQAPAPQVLGVFSLYFRQPIEPRAGELDWLHHAAFLAGCALQRSWQDDRIADGEDMFRAIFENEMDAMAIIDPEQHVFVAVNPAFERMLLYSRSEAVGMPVVTISTRPEQTRLRLQQLNESAPRNVLRRRLKRRDGSVFIAETSAYFLSLHGRRLICAIARDISAQYRSERALSLAAKVYESLTDGIAISVWPGPILTANHALLQMTGFSLEQLVGQDGGFFYQDPELWQRIASRCVSSNVPGDAEVLLRRQDGTVFACLLSLHFSRTSADAPVSLIAVYQDLSVRRQQETRLLFLTNHDILTRLPNRFLFYRRLDQAIAAAADDGRRFTVLSIDLDRFKNINETLGHPTGDLLLRLIAERIAGCVGKSDLLARFGGDEFTILAESVPDESGARQLAARIVQALARPFEIEGQELFVSASIGISLFPQDGGDAETLIRSADIALYRAKGEGKNNYQFFAADMSRASRERMQLENALRHALAAQEFVLYYQPKVRISSAGIYGMEALLRWDHPQLGLLNPVRFIPLAEEMGLIRDIGSWALQQACHQNALWQQAGIAPLVVSVNLSGLQLTDGVLEVVGAALDDSHLPARWLELELTESTVMGAPETNARMLHALRAMGVKLSIDDFGTGYSSLSYLKRFPIDTLKIDQSFVRDIVSDPNDAAIIDAIIALARSLNIGVIAEGVETTEQLHFLRDSGCDSYQGFLFSEPLATADFERLLRAQPC